MARNTVYRIKADFVPRGELERRRSITLAREAAERAAEKEARRTYLVPWDGRVRLREPSRSLAQAFIEDHIHSPLVRDIARVASHGVARTGTGLLRLIDAPNRLLGLENSPYRRFYEGAEAGLAADRYEMGEAVPQLLETAVHLGTSGGVFGKALPAAFGTEVGLGTYESSRAAGMPVVEALSRGISHGVVDTAIWTAGAGLSSKYLPKAWQQLGHQITGAARGASSSLVSDMVADSANMLSDDVSMGERAVHAAWMVPLLGMLKMGGKRREEAMSLLRKARPDLADAKADKVIETIEAEFADPRSQKVALAWVARKGANLPDDIAQIRQALEVSSKVKGLDPMSRSPFEILSNPAYARYLPKPRPQDVKAFTNMKRYPMGVIGFDVSDDAAGRQATREMINAYMSPSSNPWCLATGSGAAKLGGLGPGAESYWKQHSAVPKQIFFQEVDGKLELTAFRATSHGGEGRQEYWDTSDAGYSGIPLKVKVPGDPMGRYRKMVFRPADSQAPVRVKLPMYSNGRFSDQDLRRMIAIGNNRLELEREQPGQLTSEEIARQEQEIREARQGLAEITETRKKLSSGEVQGTFEDIAPGKVFKGDPFRDGRSQTWAVRRGMIRGTVDESGNQVMREMPTEYFLIEDKVRTTENGITKFRTTKYTDPTDPVARMRIGIENLKIGQPVEIEESELVSPEWMRSHGYDPESESDVRRMQHELGVQAWGNGVEAAMVVVPTKRTFMGVGKTGTPETVTYGPNGFDIVSVDFEENGVPYREEYFNTGRYAGQVPLELRSSGLDITGPVSGVRRAGLDEVRLIRNPGGADAEVLSETRYDKDLGTFVRTVGNRRSYVAGQDISKEERDRASAYEDAIAYRLSVYGAGEGAYPAELPDGTVVMTRDQVRDLANMLRINAHRYTYPSYDFPMLAAFSENFPNAAAGIMSDLPTIRGGRIQTNRVLRTEDHQPDGTWVPVETRNILQVSPSRTNTLPPPPDEIPLDVDLDGQVIPFALKAGRTRGNVRAAEGGGDNFGTFRNFLATDKVPESIFGIPVVQGGYSEEDAAFFRDNPKAAGFYEMGDEEPPAEEPPAEEPPAEEPPPRMAEGAGVTFDTPLSKEQEAEYRKWRATLPKALQYEGDYDLRGYWLDPQTVKQGIKDGQHFTDRYKKPNHPTFSVESKYAVGAYKTRAGRWNKDEFVRPDRMGAYPGASNNPGNVEKHERRSDKTLFAGEDGGGVRPDRFARFDDPVAGLNAMAAVLARRANELEARGVPFTIENYVPGYAPKSENDVERYIRNISRYSGLKRSAALDRRNVDAMAGLLKTVVRFESGYPHSQWFTDDEYRAAAELLQEGAFD